MVNDLTVTLFGRQALNKQMSFKDTLTLLQSLDLIDIGELAEKAVSKKTGVPQAGKCQAKAKSNTKPTPNRPSTNHLEFDIVDKRDS